MPPDLFVRMSADAGIAEVVRKLQEERSDGTPPPSARKRASMASSSGMEVVMEDAGAVATSVEPGDSPTEKRLKRSATLGHSEIETSSELQLREATMETPGRGLTVEEPEEAPEESVADPGLESEEKGS